ncbi:MAG TPA: IPT/TIG domain-containing protein, partial [Thermoanaerobaculia bacterium]
QANWGSSAGANGYRLDVSPNSSFSSFISGYNNLDVGNTQSQTVSGLSAATTYFYRVRAYNGSGTSGNSNTIGTATNGSGNPAPTVSNATPNSGSASGGTSVTITGTGFLAGATVTFGGSSASSVSVNGTTSITCTTPAHSAGAVTVIVTNTDAQSGQLSSGFTYTGSTTSAYDGTLRAPLCSAPSSVCDSGSLLVGRSSVGPEPNAPNTLQDSCADGGAGGFHSDESLDRLIVSTVDGSVMAPGKQVWIDAWVWAYSEFASDHLDLYYASNASAPSWTYLTTLTPTVAGLQQLSTQYTLPSGSSVQAIRGVFRFNGSASSCGTNSGYDDYDDLAFAVSGQSGGGSGRSLYLVTPCRLLDTRSANNPLWALDTRTIISTGACGIPADARAITYHITVVSPAAAGWLTLYPSDIARPLASTISFRAGRTRANNGIAGLSSIGQMNVYNGSGAGDAVHFIIDVTGYFK